MEIKKHSVSDGLKMMNSTPTDHEALFLDVAMGAMTPKRESKREFVMSIPIFSYIYIYMKRLNMVTHEPLTFRLPFGGHDNHGYVQNTVSG